MASRFRLIGVTIAAVGVFLLGCAAPGASPTQAPSPAKGAEGTTPRPAPEPIRETGPPWNRATAHPDRVILTWSDDPSTTQSVTWRTDTSVDVALGQVAPATSHPLFGDSAVLVLAETRTLDVTHLRRAGVKVNYHSVTFNGLEPGTLYAYRVGDGERWSEWLQFRTASDEAEPFSFLYLGDAQNDILSAWSQTVRAAYAQAPKARFMIHAGDLVNRGDSDQEWGEWFRGAGHIFGMVPSVPAPGNHEYSRHTAVDGTSLPRQLSAFWRPQFTLPENGAPGITPEFNYVLDFQDLRLIVLNSSEDLREQTRWLENTLSENTARWTVAVHHHPVFSTAGDRDNDALRKAWKPLYDRYGVDLVLQGHDHTYARGRAGSSQAILASQTNLRNGNTGTVYVVSVAGPKMYDFKPENWDSYDAILDRRAEDTQLFQVVEVAGDILRFRTYTVGGELFDAFDLLKERGQPNRIVDRSSESF